MKKVQFTDTPVKVDDGRGKPFYIVYVSKSIWRRVKYFALLGFLLGLINVSALAYLLFVTFRR